MSLSRIRSVWDLYSVSETASAWTCLSSAVPTSILGLQLQEAGGLQRAFELRDVMRRECTRKLSLKFYALTQCHITELPGFRPCILAGGFWSASHARLGG